MVETSARGPTKRDAIRAAFKEHTGTEYDETIAYTYIGDAMASETGCVEHSIQVEYTDEDESESIDGHLVQTTDEDDWEAHLHA